MAIDDRLREAALELGDLRRVTPISTTWGLDRGGPLDRFYIENFLRESRSDIRGRVLEVKDPGYASRFGDPNCRIDVLDIVRTNAQATVIADLAEPDSLPAELFDCFIFTQTLHIIYDVHAAMKSVHRLLRPGGVVLCTVPVVSRVNYEDGGLESGDYWRFTGAAIRRLFEECFPGDAVEVRGYGNVLVCAAFLYGLAPSELTPEELASTDPWFPLLFTVRAVRPPR